MHHLTFVAGSPPWDESVFRALNLAGMNRVLDALMVLFTLLGGAYILALLAVPLWWRGRREAAFDLLVLIGLAIGVTEALKLGIGRPRPCAVLPGVHTLAGFGCDVEFDPAFPSGHASRAFAIAAFLALRYRWRLGAAGAAFAVLVGVSRIYLGVHWPTDVAAGAAFGIGLALLVEFIDRRSPRYRRLRGRIVDAIPRRRTGDGPRA